MSFYLKPCPFCGRPAVIEETSIAFDSTRIIITCTGCGVTLDHTQEFAVHEVRNPINGELIEITRVALNDSAMDIWDRRVGDDL